MTLDSLHLLPTIVETIRIISTEHPSQRRWSLGSTRLGPQVNGSSSFPRRSHMRRFIAVAALALFASATLASSASAVPSFTRQTGLTCNQCHITFSNVPDFTFTGKKFRL